MKTNRKFIQSAAIFIKSEIPQFKTDKIKMYFFNPGE
jgi:hypothetical protein